MFLTTIVWNSRGIVFRTGSRYSRGLGLGMWLVGNFLPMTGPKGNAYTGSRPQGPLAISCFKLSSKLPKEPNLINLL